MLKRAFDLFAASVILIITSPIILMVAIAIWLIDGGPVLFRQIRPGYRGKLFTIYKFKTMNNTVSKSGELLPDANRLTWLGKLLRKTSLDELPQLLNVIKGELSLVGPRPLLIEYLPLYTKEQQRRHDVLPGITGWVQVNGRNNLSWDEKFTLDIWYVDNHSFYLDMKILFLTLCKVIKASDISQDNHATMPKFTGSKKEK